MNKFRDDKIVDMFSDGEMIRVISKHFVLTKMRVIQILVKNLGRESYQLQLKENILKHKVPSELREFECKCGCGKIIKSYTLRSFYNLGHFRKWQSKNKKPIDLEKRRKQMRDRYHNKYKLKK